MKHDATAALRAEITAAERNVGKRVRRPGCDYARFGYALDAAIEDKRSFAVDWRRWVLELAAGRQIQSRTVTVYGYGDVEVHERVYRVFSTGGVDFDHEAPQPFVLGQELLHVLLRVTADLLDVRAVGSLLAVSAIAADIAHERTPREGPSRFSTLAINSRLLIGLVM